MVRNIASAASGNKDLRPDPFSPIQNNDAQIRIFPFCPDCCKKSCGSCSYYNNIYHAILHT
jgi:hypothetical protein